MLTKREVESRQLHAEQLAKVRRHVFQNEQWQTGPGEPAAESTLNTHLKEEEVQGRGVWSEPQEQMVLF